MTDGDTSPLGLTMLRSMCKVLMLAKTCAAKASFSSATSRSWMVSPAFFKAFCVAGTGPIPMILGSTPAAPIPATRAMGVRPNCFTISSEARMQTAAPSLIPELLPAVTEPPSLKAGLSDASTLTSLSRGCSSVSKSIASPFFEEWERLQFLG